MKGQLRLWDEEPVLHNVFFAVRPSAVVAEQITCFAQDIVRDRRLAARPLPAERLHISLVAVGSFSGACPPTVIDTARAIANGVSMAPFKVAFDRVAAFAGGKGKQALVLAGNEGVTGLVLLQEALNRAMTTAGLEHRHARQFTPHITMMYADGTADFPIEPLTWTVNEFVLIDSLWGKSTHITLDRFPL